HTSRLIAILLDASCERAPLSVESVPCRIDGIIDGLAIEVHDVRSCVRECPRYVAVESNHDCRRTGNRNSVNVELSRHYEMHFVPDAWERQLQMRVTGQQRVAVLRARWRYRPVVA